MMERCSATMATSAGLMICPKPSVGEWWSDKLEYLAEKIPFPLCEVHMRMLLVDAAAPRGRV